MITKEEVYTEIEINHLLTGGMCGLSMVKLMQSLNISYRELLPLLSELKRENRIAGRKGLNGFLLFLR